MGPPEYLPQEIEREVRVLLEESRQRRTDVMIEQEWSGGDPKRERRPTIYEAAGITPPRFFGGVRQQPIEGMSMVYTFDHPEAPSRHREQYFEFPRIGRGWSMTAHLEIADSQATGPIVVQGDEFGGMGLLVEEGRPEFLYNPSGRESERVSIESAAPLAAGDHTVSVRAQPRPGAGRMSRSGR